MLTARSDYTASPRRARGARPSSASVPLQSCSATRKIMSGPGARRGVATERRREPRGAAGGCRCSRARLAFARGAGHLEHGRRPARNRRPEAAGERIRMRSHPEGGAAEPHCECFGGAAPRRGASARAVFRTAAAERQERGGLLRLRLPRNPDASRFPDGGGARVARRRRRGPLSQELRTTVPSAARRHRVRLARSIGSSPPPGSRAAARPTRAVQRSSARSSRRRPGSRRNRP